MSLAGGRVNTKISVGISVTKRKQDAGQPSVSAAVYPTGHLVPHQASPNAVPHTQQESRAVTWTHALRKGENPKPTAVAGPQLPWFRVELAKVV